MTKSPALLTKLVYLKHPLGAALELLKMGNAHFVSFASEQHISEAQR